MELPARIHIPEPGRDTGDRLSKAMGKEQPGSPWHGASMGKNSWKHCQTPREKML